MRQTIEETDINTAYRLYLEYGLTEKIPHFSTISKNNQKVVILHIWEEYIEKCEDIRHAKGFKKKHSRRKETIERVFADAKELHGMRYILHRGLEKVKNELYLLFGCMNLKKLANIILNRDKDYSCFYV
ncbi:transposase [Miniphocaeibacter sp.]